MNISDRGHLNDLAGLLSGLNDVQRVNPKSKETAAPKEREDQVRISDRAKQFQQLSQLVTQTPDVRTDKVEKIQAAIKSGSYNVRGEQVADKLIANTVLDEIL
jgi:negative regulator of flagellin synthesis FlgM